MSNSTYLSMNTQSACPHCNCQDSFDVTDSVNGNSTFPNATKESITLATTDGSNAQMTTASQPWTIQSKEEYSMSEDYSQSLIAQRACGLQLYPSS